MSQKCEQFSYGTSGGIFLGFLVPLRAQIGPTSSTNKKMKIYHMYYILDLRRIPFSYSQRLWSVFPGLPGNDFGGLEATQVATRTALGPPKIEVVLHLLYTVYML